MGETHRGARFEIYEDGAGEWRWRLKAANGEIIAQGEGHPNKFNARRAAYTVRDTAIDAIVQFIE